MLKKLILAFALVVTPVLAQVEEIQQSIKPKIEQKPFSMRMKCAREDFVRAYLEAQDYIPVLRTNPSPDMAMELHVNMAEKKTIIVVSGPAGTCLSSVMDGIGVAKGFKDMYWEYFTHQA